jgi:hypothetical protein
MDLRCRVKMLTEVRFVGSAKFSDLSLESLHVLPDRRQIHGRIIDGAD